MYPSLIAEQKPTPPPTIQTLGPPFDAVVLDRLSDHIDQCDFAGLEPTPASDGMLVLKKHGPGASRDSLGGLLAVIHPDDLYRLIRVLTEMGRAAAATKLDEAKSRWRASRPHHAKPTMPPTEQRDDPHSGAL